MYDNDQAPTLPLSLACREGMTAHHDSKYGLGERVGAGFWESPSAASRRRLNGDAEERDRASRAHICPSMVRHDQWLRRGNLRSVEMLRYGKLRRACPDEANGLSVKVGVRRLSE